jgi:hypothetical protein
VAGEEYDEDHDPDLGDKEGDEIPDQRRDRELPIRQATNGPAA